MIDHQIGHYRLLGKLGAGGMGEVYRAEDRLLDRLVALKVLSPKRAGDPLCLERFRREARSVAALNHPNIVTIYSVEESDGLSFLTMELIEGTTLRGLIPPGGMPLRSLLEIAVPLADALEAAHARGIVHRDLKPDNVMVSREERVKVLDFGIAKAEVDPDATLFEEPPAEEAEEKLTRTGLIVGTPAYMAPEQLLGRPVDHRVDLFAFGALLFEMATGQRAFQGGGVSEIIVAILRDTPPPPSSLNHGVPADLDVLIGRCLEKEASRRIQSAAELRELLKALSSGLSAGSSASRSPAEPRLPPALAWQRRWRQPAMLLLALTGCLVLALTAGWARFSHVPRIPASPSATAFTGAREAQSPGLAVLPLGNFSNDPEYFVDGMTDSLISSLADIRGVRVISRQSVMRFKGSSAPLPQIAGELGVNLIVQGSVLRAGNRVRITAHLIRAAPEQQLWARSYERDLSDILSLQEDVAEAIAREIRGKLDPADKRRLAAGRLVDPKAFDAYLRGRHIWNRRTNDNIAQALQLYQEALDRDPGFALAHASLADAYAWAGFFEALPPREAFRQAARHAKAALEIDPELADAHVALGHVQLTGNRDWQSAEASFRRALAIQPNHPTAHYLYWLFLYLGGRREEAREQIRRAAELDPLSPIITLNLGVEECLAGREDEALRLWNKAQTLDPGQPGTYYLLSVFYLRKGNSTLSYEYFHKSMARRYKNVAPQMDRAYRARGRKAALEAAAQALESLARQRPVRTDDLAHVYQLLGRRDKALDWLEKVYERDSPAVIFFRHGWTLQALRSEPRFQALLRKID